MGMIKKTTRLNIYKGYKSDYKKLKELYKFENMVLTDGTLNDLEKLVIRDCIEKMRKGRSNNIITKLVCNG